MFRPSMLRCVEDKGQYLVLRVKLKQDDLHPTRYYRHPEGLAHGRLPLPSYLGKGKYHKPPNKREDVAGCPYGHKISSCSPYKDLEHSKLQQFGVAPLLFQSSYWSLGTHATTSSFDHLQGLCLRWESERCGQRSLQGLSVCTVFWYVV